MFVQNPFFLNEACPLKVSVRPEALELVKSYFSASRSARSMALELEFPRSQTSEIIKFVKILLVFRQSANLTDSTALELRARIFVLIFHYVTLLN